jgi:hypothetical protein
MNIALEYFFSSNNRKNGIEKKMNKEIIEIGTNSQTTLNRDITAKRKINGILKT